MCTVTFIPVNHTVFITHNRDEHKDRPPALPPAMHKRDDAYLLYPKDSKAGGSWIGMRSNGNAAVLLNGAFAKHHPTPPYGKSRGLVFLDLLSDDDMVGKYASTDLGQIEPFTIILCNGFQLHECRWDGTAKHVRQLDASECHIWSSATLYDHEVTSTRRSWFESWRMKNPSPTYTEVLDFHKTAGEGDNENDLLMSRENGLRTLSITSLNITEDYGIMNYLNLDTNQSTEKKILFQKAPVKN